MGSVPAGSIGSKKRVCGGGRKWRTHRTQKRNNIWKWFVSEVPLHGYGSKWPQGLEMKPSLSRTSFVSSIDKGAVPWIWILAIEMRLGIPNDAIDIHRRPVDLA